MDSDCNLTHCTSHRLALEIEPLWLYSSGYHTLVDLHTNACIIDTARGPGRFCTLHRKELPTKDVDHNTCYL